MSLPVLTRARHAPVILIVQNPGQRDDLVHRASAFLAVGGFDESFFGAEELVMSRALKRHGKFVVLRHAVTTSGRKLRTHSAREILMVMCRLMLRGPSAVKQRQGMELWYGERREDKRGT